MKYKLRLCIKRILDVEIEAKTQKEVISKGYEMLKRDLRAKGVNGKGATQIKWIETGNSEKSRFGELPVFR
jgi:hypothetical protein